jgi:hypothetical protein
MSTTRPTVSLRLNACGEAEVTRHEKLFALSGGVMGVLATYGWVRLSNARADTAARVSVAAVGGAVDARPDDDGDPSTDPAMVANAGLAQSLLECSQRLAQVTDDKDLVVQQMEAERTAEADASRSAKARRLARRDVSQSDWKQLASAGTIRYLLPCASFNPTPDVLERLGLEARDVPVVQSAFAASRDAAWAQIRSLCVAAAGSTVAADRLGLDSCPQVIFDAEKATDPAGADSAMRAVGALRAGLAEPSAVPSGDPVGAAFLVLTGIAKEAENRLGSVLGPDDARSAVYGNGNCGRTTEFTSPGPGSDP